MKTYDRGLRPLPINGVDKICLLFQNECRLLTTRLERLLSTNVSGVCSVKCNIIVFHLQYINRSSNPTDNGNISTFLRELQWDVSLENVANYADVLVPDEKPTKPSRYDFGTGRIQLKLSTKSTLSNAIATRISGAVDLWEESIVPR